ncbi:MAG: type II secretion system F family protein [Parcubacteria group bacterium]|nr:type II secretion system F family protein [Parcubacteria group bacterium]MCR4342755.1 type II secretion system F family protein [Patescibacteria group bacterium]
MLYIYETTDKEGKKSSGSVDAPSIEIAINSLQRRGLIILAIKPEAEAVPFLNRNLNIFERIKTKDVVIFSRQISTLFEAKVPIIDSFRLLASESASPLMKEKLEEIVADIQGGAPMSAALSKHPKVFSKFFVNMVKSGEESGKLDEIFTYLADYMERSYELASKAKRALFYPAFVVFAFFGVMILMFTVVIPKIGVLLDEVGKEVPLYTRIIMGIGNFFQEYILYMLILVIIGAIIAWRYIKTENGQYFVAKMMITLPLLGLINKKIYVARLTDNLQTLLSGGVPMIKAVEITADVVGNKVYQSILLDVAESIKGGGSLSESLRRYEEIPALVPQMLRVGEEGGRLDFILETMARFYKREVDNTIENLIGLIEPVMIIVLAIFVGFLLIAVIGPIYNISSGI